jgi:hypothetical protein
MIINLIAGMLCASALSFHTAIKKELIFPVDAPQSCIALVAKLLN